MRFAKIMLIATTFITTSGLAARADVNVVASIKPVHSLVAAVMEGVGTPDLIVEGAGSPHTYSLKPSQARMLESADVVFWVGHDLETFLEKPLETLAAKAKTIELLDAHGLVKMAFREGGAFDDHDDHAKKDDHDDHDDHGDDPHVWLDTVNAKALVHEIEEALAAADPKNAPKYEANADKLMVQIDALSAEITKERAPVKGKGFIVFHDAYHYFETRFGLQAAGSISVSPETMPGAERITEIRNRVKTLGAACVFAEPQFEPKLVATVIEGSNAKSGVLDPLGASLKDGPSLYFDLMRAMAKSFKTCLGGAG
jgi:zinc transport system substrate-binding protein